MAASLASGLPSDILRLIFEILDQPSVLACAAVCPEWRATAVLDRSYYRALTLRFPTGGQSHPVANQHQTHENSLNTLRRATRDAEEFNYSISLTMEVRVDLEALSVDDADNTLAVAIQKYETGARQIEQEVVPALRSSISHLVRLDMQVEDDFMCQLLPALTVPAPRLRTLRVHLGVIEHGWDQTLPRDLFAGHAPLLMDVNISCLQLHAPAPCFEHVRRLQWNSERTRRNLDEMISCFPRVCHFALHGLPRSLDDPVSDVEAAFFGRLQSLYIGHNVYAHALAPFLPAIVQNPDVELCADGNVDPLAELLGHPAPAELILSEHMTQDRRRGFFSYLRVHLGALSATRVMNSCVKYDVTLRALKLSSASLSLTKVTVDDRHVRELLQLCPSMPVLEHLIVTLISWTAVAPHSPQQLVFDPFSVAQKPNMLRKFLPKRFQRRLFGCTCPMHPFFALDARPPDEKLTVDYPRLRTLELRATHAHATVRADILSALARCLGPLHLVLSNGASLDSGAPEAAFSSIHRGSPEEFVPSLDTARVAELLETAARQPERMHIYHCPHFPRRRD